jgi:hypothetical protein
MVTGEILPDWLDDVDLGTAPGWLGAGSLILAFVIFLRDRRNGERSQVDLVGAWGEARYLRVSPDKADIVDPVTIQMHLRNASELPVIVKLLAYEVHTRWAVRESEYSWEVIDAAEPSRAFVPDVQLAPGETKDIPPHRLDVTDHAPKGSNQLDIVNGVTVRVAWLLLIDNAGRRWVVKPHKGRRARQARRWWRPEEYMPAKW